LKYSSSILDLPKPKNNLTAFASLSIGLYYCFHTPKFYSIIDVEDSNGNKKRLKAWLQINLKGTFTREIPWL
jgi:hypothetical protein